MIFFPSHAFSFLPILPLLLRVWHMPAFLCRPVGLQQMWHHYSSTPFCAPPPNLADSPASLSPTHSFLLSASAHTAILIWQTRSERLTRVERWGDEEKRRSEKLRGKIKKGTWLSVQWDKAAAVVFLYNSNQKRPGCLAAILVLL